MAGIFVWFKCDGSPVFLGLPADPWKVPADGTPCSTNSVKALKAMCTQYTTYIKKLSYRRGTARCVVAIKILPVATQQCRNYLYDKS